MSANLIQYAFAAGEIAPKLIGRSDLEKYDLGVALARNWFVDYRGGISTRPGSEFIGFIKDDDKEVKLFDFVFSPDIANTYCILFGDGYVRFVQDGAYVVESDVAVTGVTQASPGVITATAHGYADGDNLLVADIVGMTELNGRTIEVASSTANTFEITDHFGVALDTSGFTVYISGGTLARIYTITSPYAVADLAKLKSYQVRDTLRLTHPDYDVRNLTRFAATNWTITTETISNDLAVPGNLSHTSENTGSSGAAFAVSAVDAKGNESLVSARHFVLDSNNYTTSDGSVHLSWDSSVGAVSYRVYRSIFTTRVSTLNSGMQLGFLGDTFGLSFQDANIIPNFTQTPVRGLDPFADSTITAVTITANGSGYFRDDTVSISGAPGTGFVGILITNTIDDTVVGVEIVNGGSGYVNPVVSFNTSFGTGATADATVGPATGNNPGEATTFQQRQLYAASTNDPLDIWASKTGLLSNFDVSKNVVDNDSWNFTIDSQSVTPIRHISSQKIGLIVFAHTAIWQLRGNATDDFVTATNALADPQSYLGISEVPPLNIDADILYMQASNTAARLLSLTEFAKFYDGRDISILSSHLITVENPVVRWGYAATPHKVVHAPRQDGTMLSFTIVQEHQVEGWTWSSTDGKYKDVVTIEENGIDRIYMIVQREIGGVQRKYLERQALRDVKFVEDSRALDSALTVADTLPAGELTAAAITGTGIAYTVTGATPFVAGDVGSVIVSGGGKAVITVFVSSTEVTCTILRDITDINYETNIPFPIATGGWSMNAKITQISGLHHLEGKSVGMFGNGSVFPNQTVTGGIVTFPSAITKPLVGLGFTCVLRTLPLTVNDTVIESRRKLPAGVAVKISESRGLKVGAELDNLTEIKERTTEQWGEPVPLKSNTKYEIFAGTWDINGQTYIVQDNPLPATLLGIVTEVEVGDDTG